MEILREGTVTITAESGGSAEITGFTIKNGNTDDLGRLVRDRCRQVLKNLEREYPDPPVQKVAT